MARNRWLEGVSAVIALLATAGPSPALAYIDPAPLLLEKAAVARAKLEYQTLVAEGRSFEPGADPVEVWEGVWTDHAHRRELRHGEITEVILTIGQRRWRYEGSEAGAAARVRPDPWQVFVVEAGGDPNGRRGVALLQAYGIDETVVSMARQDGRPAYILGAKPWQEELPQLWLDAELLTPARLVFFVDGVRHELRWLGFGSPLTGPFYPRAYEERVDGELALRIEYTRVEPNASIDERRFRAPH